MVTEFVKLLMYVVSDEFDTCLNIFHILRSAMEVFEASHHRGRWKRQSGVGDGPKSVPAPQSSTGQKIRDEFNKDVNFVAQKAGVQTYHVIIFIVIVLIAVVGLLAWCVVRFFRKKRRGKDDKADLAADEAALVENEEEDMKVISATNLENYSGDCNIF